MIPFLFPLGIFLAVILIWFFFRSGGYKRHPLDAPPGADWTLTSERFLRSAIGRDAGSLVLPAHRGTRLCAGARRRSKIVAGAAVLPVYRGHAVRRPCDGGRGLRVT